MAYDDWQSDRPSDAFRALAQRLISDSEVADFILDSGISPKELIDPKLRALVERYQKSIQAGQPPAANPTGCADSIENSDALWKEHLQACSGCSSLTQAVHDACAQLDTREAELQSLVTYTYGRLRLSWAFSQLLLTKVTEAVTECTRTILSLAVRARNPDIDLFRLRLAETAPLMCTGLWRRLTANTELDLGPMGADANLCADTAATDLRHKVMSMAAPELLGQSSEYVCEQAARAGEPNPSTTERDAGRHIEPGVWLIPSKQFEAFIEKIWVDGRRRITKTDIDRVAKKSRDTREDLEAGKGNARSYAAYSRVLQLDASTFLAERLASATRSNYIHARGVVHRDLKPENAMLDAEDLVKLIDFGIAAKAEARRLTFGNLSNMTAR